MATFLGRIQDRLYKYFAYDLRSIFLFEIFDRRRQIPTSGKNAIRKIGKRSENLFFSFLYRLFRRNYIAPGIEIAKIRFVLSLFFLFWVSGACF